MKNNRIISLAIVTIGATSGLGALSIHALRAEHGLLGGLGESTIATEADGGRSTTDANDRGLGTVVPSAQALTSDYSGPNSANSDNPTESGQAFGSESDTQQPGEQLNSASSDLLIHDPAFSWQAKPNPFIGQTLYVSAHDPAGATADTWESSNPDASAKLRKISGQPIAVWLTRGTSNLGSYVSGIMDDAHAKGQLPVFVVYGMPAEGCTGLPASADDYMAWVQIIRASIGSRQAVVILEPDELAITYCGPEQESQRISVLASAALVLGQGERTSIYIDAGHSNWVTASTMAQRLASAGVHRFAGFSLNVSNYRADNELLAYGNQISGLLGGSHFVIDTSRNGLGPTADSEWCNALGRALGKRPGLGQDALDAYLWIKYPGESDGTCNGGPSEGKWWPEYAVGLAERASW